MPAALIAKGLALVFPFIAAAEATAEENCRNFSWSVGRSIDLFDEPLPMVQSAQSLPKEGVFAVMLRPLAEVIYPTLPERGSDGAWGAVITLENVAAGRYQIALSEEAWIEAIQDNARLPIRPSGRKVECRGVRRSFEIEVKGEPLTLQLGGAGVRRMNIAVVRVWPFEWRW
ncbi:hypothetical protein [Reyranella sp.]|uniref:hypothetical protein n=1 Tax=Reyranella sp. TaxID=1929291 RepID=UPI003D115553